MKAILEADEKGVLQVPQAMLPVSTPRGRYAASLEDGMIVIKPIRDDDEERHSASPTQRAASFRRFIARHKVVGGGLSDWAVSRDSIYE